MADFSFDIATPAPQAPENGVQVFKLPNQSEWRVFVQAGPSGISIRRQLIRTLKQAGAIIDLDPKAARVILVAPTTREGRILIRNWSNFEDKVVLNYNWVEKSIAAGKPLDEAENWGECRAVDDGLPIEEDNAGEESFELPPSVPRKSGKVEDEQAERLKHTSPTPTIERSEPPSQPAQSSANSPVPPSQPFPFSSQVSPDAMAPQAAMLQNFASMFNAPQQAGPTQLTPDQQQLMVNLLASQQFFSMPFPWNQLSMPANGANFPSPFGSLSSQPQAANSQSQSTPTIQSSQPDPNTQSSTKQSRSSSKRKSFAATPTVERDSRSASAGPSRSPNPHASLFISPLGEPLLFFVQINLKDRRNIVGKIQKGGGKIISDHIGAQYAILSSQADHFNTLLDGITAAGKQAHNVNFIHACFEENRIVDPSPFAFEPQLDKKKKQKSSTIKQEEVSPQKVSRKRSHDSPASVKTKKPRSEAEPARVSEPLSSASGKHKEPGTVSAFTAPPTIDPKPPKQPSTNGKPKARAKAKSGKASPRWKSTSILSGGPRSPSPPPENTRQEGFKGYKFTPEENEYALRYIRILLERDPEMTLTAICKALYSKMDHHTTGSYMTHFGNNYKQEIAEIRKRASIAYRKRQNDARAGTSMSVDSPAPATPESARRQNNDHETLLEEDLETVSRYFAFGGGDSGENEDDDIIWRRLTDQVKCKTATSWADFYTIHSGEVMKRFEKLVRDDEQ